MDSNKDEYITTTRPVIPPYSDHPTIITEHPRVVLRPFKASDLDELHELRTQVDVMKWTSTTKIDASLEQTRTWLSRFMDIEEDLHRSSSNEVSAMVKSASNSSTRFNFAIVYRSQPHGTADSNHQAEKTIGAGGCHVFEPEPEVGYMIRKEYWGQGIATAVLKAFLSVYWNLERETVKIPASSIKDISRRVSTSGTSTTSRLEEVLTAVLDAANIASQRVLEKCGFKYQWSEPIEENGSTITLAHYTLDRPLS